MNIKVEKSCVKPPVFPDQITFTARALGSVGWGRGQTEFPSVGLHNKI